MVRDALLGNLLILVLRFPLVCALRLAQSFDFEVDLVAAGLLGLFVRLGNFEDPALLR